MFFFLTEIPIQRRNLVNPFTNGPYLALKGMFIATFSLLKRSKSVYLTLIERNSHYDITWLQVFLYLVVIF